MAHVRRIALKAFSMGMHTVALDQKGKETCQVLKRLGQPHDKILLRCKELVTISLLNKETLLTHYVSSEDYPLFGSTALVLDCQVIVNQPSLFLMS